MPKFEVFIPAADETGFDMTFRVDADNWMAALKTGMEKIGQQGPGGNILCDIKDDNSIHVTDPGSGKVFRILEVPADGVAAAPQGAATKTDPGMPAAGSATEPNLPVIEEEPKTVPFARAQEPTTQPPAPARTQVAPAAPPAQAAPPPAVEPPPAAPPAQAAPAQPPPPAATGQSDTAIRTVEQLEAPSRPVLVEIGRKKIRSKKEIEDILADLFEEVQGIFDQPNAKKAFGFTLDLAMKHVPSESGSAYRADISAHVLQFAAVRGPKADELMRMNPKVPVGSGLVGVSVQEGVSIAISDADKDPRFFRSISEKLGYECKSVLTVPIQFKFQVMGALQLINKTGGGAFDESDLAVMNYLAHEAGEYLRRSGEVTV